MDRSHEVIFYAAQSLPASSSACAVRCFHLIRALQRSGYRVDVWSHTPGSRSTALLLPFVSNRWPTPLRMLLEALMGVELIFRLTLRRYFSPPAVVVLSSPPFVSCFFAAVACRALGIRYVWDARDLYPEVLFNFGVVKRDSAVGRWMAGATRSIYRHALFVSTPSDSFVETLRRQVDEPSKVLLVRNGFDEEMFPSKPPTTRAGKPFVCVNHGLLGRMHNIKLLLQVAEIVDRTNPDIVFHVIGSGPKQYFFEGDIGPNVRYFGHRSHSEIPGFLFNADVGLAFIEDGEGTDGAFPVKIYEYIGAGLPTLVTPISEAGRLVASKGIGACFENCDATSIAKLIIELSARGEQLDRWRDNVEKSRDMFFRSKWANDFCARLSEALR